MSMLSLADDMTVISMPRCNHQSTGRFWSRAVTTGVEQSHGFPHRPAQAFLQRRAGAWVFVCVQTARACPFMIQSFHNSAHDYVFDTCRNRHCVLSNARFITWVKESMAFQEAVRNSCIACADRLELREAVYVPKYPRACFLMSTWTVSYRYCQSGANPLLQSSHDIALASRVSIA
jgi:hypothetical protein